MSTVQRVVDRKRRITLPANGSFKAGTEVTIVSSSNALFITPDSKLAEQVKPLIRTLELKREFGALDEWEKLLKDTGLLGLTSRKIEARVREAVRRPSNIRP